MGGCCLIGLTGHSQEKTRYLTIKTLVGGCISSIEALYDADQHLLVNLRDLERGVNQGVNLRYTAMTLIGLCKAVGAGYQTALPLDDIATATVAACESAPNAGDVALTLWAVLIGRTGQHNRLWTLLRKHAQIGGFKRLCLYDTMELAWVVTGLSLLWQQTRDQAVGDAAQIVYEELCRGQHPTSGLFAYSTRRAGWASSDFMHTRFGTFANQSYPTYALATYAEALDKPAALRRAEQCADAFCRLQGPLGQWWWIYDVPRGRVAEKYGVYAVHQDGMGPMALDRIRLAGGKNYATSIEKSWAWLDRNELGEAMIEPDTHHIRRAITRRGPYRVLYHVNILLATLGLRPITAFDGHNYLRVLDQTRPYHPGWALVYLCGGTE